MDEPVFNLLDPCMYAVDFSHQDKNNDKKCAEILSSSNPDKDYEFFWLTFKNSIIPYVGKDVDMIKKFSKSLDVLQKEKKYDEIKDEITIFLYKHAESIAAHLIFSSCYVTCMHFTVNMKRWKKIDDEFDISDPNEFPWVNNVKVIGKIGTKRSPHRGYVINELKKIYTTKDYCPLFEYGIENGLALVVDMCAYHVDFNKYFTNKSDAKKFKNSKGCKLVRLLKGKIDTK